MKSPAIALVCLLALPFGVAADPPPQKWEMQKTGVDASLRGLCVVNAKVIWASGTKGTVLRSENGGKVWHVVSVKDAAELDFRDIHAFDAKNAIVLGAGQPARVYQTSDGGESWTMRFEHPNKKSFFDSLSFWDKKHGIAMSDPVDDRVLLIETKDGGATWAELPASRRPKKERGEAGFAASGSNMCVMADQVYIALGGGEEGQTEDSSRIVYSMDRAQTWKVAKAPIPRGPSSGIFSIVFADIGNGIAVGGDYKHPEKSDGNIAVTNDGGKTWKRPTGEPPNGFRSGVAVREMGAFVVWVAVGTTGSDYSVDGGQNWLPVADVEMHAVQFSPDISAGFASGPKGRIAKWIGY